MVHNREPRPQKGESDRYPDTGPAPWFEHQSESRKREPEQNNLDRPQSFIVCAEYPKELVDSERKLHALVLLMYGFLV
jgi:hypothetical protein